MAIEDVATAVALTAEELVADNELTPDVACRLWRAVAEMSGDPAIALRAARAVPFGAFDLLDYVASNTSTIGDSLDAIARYFCTLRAQIEVAVSHHHDATVVQLRSPATFDSDLRRYSSEFTFACIVDRLRRACSPSWAPQLIRWKHAAPTDRQPYEAFFACQMRFDAEANELVVSAETRDWHMPDADPRLRALLERSSTLECQPGRPETSWTHRARMAMASGLLSRQTRLEFVAKRLQISTRTLRRRLLAEGTSFQQELDIVRSEAATRLMVRSDVTVAEVAQALGFTDVSAFTRAFRRWTGETPAAWRRSQERIRASDTASNETRFRKGSPARQFVEGKI